MSRTARSLYALAPFMITVLLFALLLPFAAGAAVAPTTSATSAAQEPAAPAQEEAVHAEQEQGDDEHAAAETHEEAAPKPWWHWPAKWFNFIMLSALLYWMLVVPPPAIQDIFSFPGLKTIFVTRAVAIIAARDLAAEQKQDAAHVLTESEQRLAKIEEEVAALVADARRDADLEPERAAEEGKAQALKIHEVARREVAHALVAAQRQLRRFVADLAVDMAEKDLAEHLTADDQDRLIREYLSRLGQSVA